MELQHGQEQRALEARCAQQVEAAKNELTANINSLKEIFEEKIAVLEQKVATGSLLASKRVVVMREKGRRPRLMRCSRKTSRRLKRARLHSETMV